MNKLKYYLLLHFSLLIYSAGNIASKLASSQDFFSFEFILYLGLLFLSLVIYAILWQQVLKGMDLTMAYANKGITILWGVLISMFIFHEKVTLTNIMGALIVIAGVIVMVIGDNKHE